MVHITAFAMIFVNIPVYANQGETYDPPMHLDKPNKGMVSFTFRFLKEGLKWDAFPRWSSSVYCPKRNLEEMTIRKTHFSLFVRVHI